MPSGPYDMRQYVEFAHTIGVAMKNNFPAEWRSWKYVLENVKKVHHYDLTNLNANQNQYINNLCAGRFTQWKSDLPKHYEKYDGLEVVLADGCPIELVDRRDEWELLCGHFHDERYLKKVKANSINRLKKKLFHCFGSRRFSYRLEEQRKFPKIEMFKKVYVRPGDELTEQLHSTMVDKGQTVLEEVASQLPPIMMDTLDQTLGHRRGNVHRGLGKARLWDLSTSSSKLRTEEVESLTSEVADLKEQTAAQQSQLAAQSSLMNQIRLTLQISSIRFSDVEPPPATSQPTATVAKTSQPQRSSNTTSRQL
ncbi:hypothetical protein D8674_000272 [Pyrus ussuriensis x Pyrus communis]|uniref:Uncharacterized protein n=1 Tax=Pyrus ussuriensis x Pyrus communis TaxID=2448454 RepID=A0A5N5F845_9ROSA|nr:hypothetical protein D8674_000272 [Pyrus ussuriensis x Pyrus communis]